MQDWVDVTLIQVVSTMELSVNLDYQFARRYLADEFALKQLPDNIISDLHRTTSTGTVHVRFTVNLWLHFVQKFPANSTQKTPELAYTLRIP